MANFGFISYFVKDLRGRNYLLGKDATRVQSAEMALGYGMSKADAKALCERLNAGEIESEHSTYRVVKLDTGHVPEPGSIQYRAIEDELFALAYVRKKPAKAQTIQA